MSAYLPSRLRFTLIAVAVAGWTMVACSSFDNASTKAIGVITPYKMDIVQGNVVTREQFALVKPGMSRAQVRDVLGTALLTSVFHADRWDYIFTLKSQTAKNQQRKVSIFFKLYYVDIICIGCVFLPYFTFIFVKKPKRFSTYSSTF